MSMRPKSKPPEPRVPRPYIPRTTDADLVAEAKAEFDRQAAVYRERRGKRSNAPLNVRRPPKHGT